MNRLVVVVTGAVAAAVAFLAIGHSNTPSAGARSNAGTPSLAALSQAAPHLLDTTLAAGTASLTHHRQNVDGQAWSVTSFTNELGQVCAGERVPNDGGEGGQGLTCRDPQSLYSDGPLVYFVGTRQLPGHLASWDNAWVWGWASPVVSRLDLQLTDCTVIPLGIDASRIFLHVLGSATLSARIGPNALLAYDASDHLLAREPTPTSTQTSAAARAAGAAPLPSNSCS